MKCLIPGVNVRILGRAIQAMAKIGDDLYVESAQDGLSLKLINSSDSAFCRILFNKSFFTYYKHNYSLADDDSSFLCKISTRSALSVFKSSTQANKQVEMCEIKPNDDGSKLVFQMRWKIGTTRSFYVSILDNKKLVVTYDKKDIPNRILAQHRVLSDAVNNFLASEDQLTFEADPQVFILKNYLDNNMDSSRITRTQLSLKPVEFEMYSINTECNVTFSLKEFRAMLAFAEAVNLPVTVYFESCGKPVIFEVNSNGTFEIDFVIATERSDNITQSTNCTMATSSKQKNSTGKGKSTFKKPFMENDSELEKCLGDSNFLDLIDNRNVYEARTTVDENELENDTFVQMECENESENRREQSCSPILNTQTNRIRKIFKRCFDNTINLPETKRKCVILADDSDCESL